MRPQHQKGNDAMTDDLLYLHDGYVLTLALNQPEESAALTQRWA